MRKRIVNDIVIHVYQNGLTYIPLDLAESFFSLNEIVRKKIRAVIKPGQPEPIIPAIRQKQFETLLATGQLDLWMS